MITEGEDLEEAQIRVTAQISEGAIESITSLSGAELVESEENTETVKIFKVKENGTFKFKIRAENGRSARVSCDVNNLVSFLIEDDILTAVNKMTSGGKKKVQVTGKISDGTETTEVYSMNVIYHKGDMVLDGTTTYDGSTLISDNKTYEFGNAEKDVATGTAESQMAQNTVVLKVEGNLTVNEGVTLTSVKSTEGYGGPKGMLVYCTGTLTNNGTISMTARGAYAKGQDVYLFKNADGTYEYVPKVGGAGGTGVSILGASSRNGNYGHTGLNRQSGGGGSGGAYNSAIQNGGSSGTSYSGGTGGGGTFGQTGMPLGPCYGEANGGKGGAGNSNGGTYTGGGAGNPGGIRIK